VDGDFRVGPWLVAPSLNAVSRNGTAVRIEPKQMEVLLCLAQHPGEPLSKEKLLRSVWPDTFVSDDVLTRSIFELRRVFEDDARESRFIQTIPKRGYRLVAPVVPIAAVPEATPQSHRDLDLTDSNNGKSRRKLWIGASALLGAIVMLLAFNLGTLRERFVHNTGLPPVHSLAILPLQNLSGDPAQEYFAAGMTDALTTELSQVSALKVVSRTSALHYKNTDRTLPEIARELGVDGLIEGTVQRSGDRVRITAQLIYGPTDRHLWAKSYERGVRDVLNLEGELARTISDEIEVKLTPQERARLSRPHQISLKALEAFRQGTYHQQNASQLDFMNGSGESQAEELATARSLFQEAINEDPTYAPAYIAFVLNKDHLSPPRPKEVEKARASIQKALELDPDLAEAHLAMANLLFGHDWNWPAADQEYRRALALNPNSADAHAAYAGYLDDIGRLDEGLREYHRLAELAPDHVFAGGEYFCRRQYDRAIELLQNDLKRHDAQPEINYALGRTYEAAGKHREAAKEWQQAARMFGYTDIADAMQRAIDAGDLRSAYRALIRAEEDLSARGDLSLVWPAQLHLLLGEKERTFRLLEQGFEDRNSDMTDLNSDPGWDPIRSDPRFKDLVRRVGLPP
jgi:TolB-like protein/DNA-binding winged helix-turn-helix (wHTH) protein